MAKEIPLSQGMVAIVDHHGIGPRAGLDNRREKLEIITHAENMKRAAEHKRQAMGIRAIDF
jgi:hypothetical protein